MVSLKTCSSCSHVNPPDARFCNQCAQALEANEHYTPRHLSEKILRTRSAMEGERKQVTVMFVDIKDSLTLSRIVEAERWHVILDRFFALLGEAVHRYEGTINQYTGDGIMALFGAPIAHEDHAVRACRAALDIRQAMAELAAELQAQDGINLQFRLGLNSGEVIVGRIGDDLRMDYTAKGQTVGLAARLEQQAPPNGLMLSSFTRDLVFADFELAERGMLSVKGFEHRIRSYELLAAASVEPARREDRLPLIGREKELVRLAAYRRQVNEERRGLLIHVSADTGLGKSRLCREFAEDCRRQGIRVSGLRGSSHHRADPVAAIREFLFSFFELNASDRQGHIKAQVEEHLQPFQPLPPLLIDNLFGILGLQKSIATGGAEVSVQVELAIALMQRLLSEGILNQHQVMVIENLQWLDDTQSQQMLGALVALLPHVPLLLLVTTRSDQELPWKNPRLVRQLSLRPLAEEQAREFLNQLIGNSPELDELRLNILEQAGGNPLFLQEVVEQLVNSGVLQRSGEGMRLKREPGEVKLPPSVTAVVAARIDTLPEHAKRLLQMAAVIGRRVPLQLLETIYERPDFHDALDELKRQGFLHRDLGPDSQEALRFSQALFQSVASSALLREQRQDIHRRIARAMADVSPLDAMALSQRAWHLAEAGQKREAAEVYLASAEAGARSDLQDALRRLDRACAVLGDDPAPEIRDLRLRVKSRWLQFAARADVAPETMEKMAIDAQGLLDAHSGLADRLRLALGQGAVALSAADGQKALLVFGNAWKLAQDSLDHDLMLMAVVPLVYAEMACGHLREAQELAEQGLALCSGGQAAYSAGLSYAPQVALQTMQAWACLWSGDTRRAMKLATAAVAGARAMNHSEQIVAALSVQAHVLAERGEGGDALHSAQIAFQLARGMKHLAALNMALIALGRSFIVAGKPTDAIVALEDGLGQTRGKAFGLGEEALMQAHLSLAHLLAGNHREARNLAQQAVKSADESHAPLSRLLALLAQIRAGLYSSRPLGFLKRYQQPLDQAEKLLVETGAELCRPQLLSLRARWMELRGESAKAAQCRQAAAVALRQAELGDLPEQHLG